tara:strand:+ start:665 stop:949 length:285 start_codon:yes stop_codon:yes gene_type:complete
MSTSYTNNQQAAQVGDDFVLSTGSSKAFFTVPAIGTFESLTLEIKQAGGTDYVEVGKLCEGDNNVSVVTARGEGNSTFRVTKPITPMNVQVFFD